MSKKQKAPLIDLETDDFTDKCMTAMEEIFSRFDENKDGVWSEQDLDKFATACNGSPFPQSSKDEIKTYFDVTEEGNLTKQGFLEMYHTQTAAEPEETWKDLRKLGYNDQLELTK